MCSESVTATTRRGPCKHREERAGLRRPTDARGQMRFAAGFAMLVPLPAALNVIDP